MVNKIDVSSARLNMNEIVEEINRKITVIGGRPSAGKTNYALGISFEVVKANGGKILYFSIEMMREKLLEKISTLSKYDWSNAFVIVDEFPMSVRNIKRIIEETVEKESISLIVIDYLQIMEFDTLLYGYTELFSYLKRITKEYEIPVLALSQLSSKVKQNGYDGGLSNLRIPVKLQDQIDMVLLLDNGSNARISEGI